MATRSSKVKGTPSHDRSTRNVPASGDLLSRDQRHAPYRPPIEQHCHGTDSGPGFEWPLHLVGRIRAPPDALAVANGEHRAAARNEAGAAVVVLDVRLGDHPPRVEDAHAVEAAESPAQQRERLGVARRLGRLAEHHADHARAAGAVRGAHEHVARVRRIARLHPAHPRVFGDQVVAVVNHTRPRARIELRLRHVHGPGEARALHQHAGEAGQVARRGVVAGLVQPDRVGVARVLEPEVRGAGVHLRHERLARPRDALREGLRSVVRALEQQRLEQVVHGHPLALTQVDARLRGHRVVGGRGEDVARLRLLKGEQRGHQLCGAGDCALCVGVLGEHHRAVAGVDHDGCPRARNRGRTLRRGGGGRGRRGEHNGQSERAAPELHSRSLIFWPATSASASSSGFSSRSRSTVVPVSAAMAPSVSPALIV